MLTVFQPIWDIIKQFIIIQVEVSEFCMCECNVHINKELKLKEINIIVQCEPTECAIYFKFISMIKLHMFRAVSLLLARS